MSSKERMKVGRRSENGDRPRNWPLNRKFTWIILMIVAVPVVLFSVVFFWNIKKNAIENKMRDTENVMMESSIQVERNLEMCNMTAQMLIYNNQLKDYLYDLKNGRRFTDNEIFKLYWTDITAVQKMVESNPYLYRTRVYVTSKLRIEKLPLLFQWERARNLDWFRENWGRAFWYYDYTDTLFPIAVAPYQDHVMALITPLWDQHERLLAVIEVSIMMEKLFPGIYSSSDSSWSCFIDQDGECYYDENERWTSVQEQILKLVKEHREDTCFATKLNGENVVIAHTRINSLHGRYIQVESLKRELEGLTSFRFIFLCCLFILVILLIALTNRVVMVMLKQFYEIMRVLKRVQNGDLEVSAEVCSRDEMGEMAVQINRMMIRIKELMAENINRELLVKNSEIRALQNQINAHFIYNVLESIKMMAEVRGDFDIADAITSLGKLLRYSMRGVAKPVTVKQEVEYIKNYLLLLNLRFDYEIYLSINMPDILWQQQIPKMSLQPIIENAVYHGIGDIAEDTSIYMKGLVFDDYFQIEITDSGRGMSKEQLLKLQKKFSGEIETAGGSGNGIGLKNVQDRIHISFGAEYGLAIESKEGCFTKVIMKLPLVKRVEFPNP